MDSPARIRSQKRVLVKNNCAQCISNILTINSYYFISFFRACWFITICWTRLLSFFVFFVGGEKIVFCQWTMTDVRARFCFQLQNLALLKVRVTFHCALSYCFCFVTVGYAFLYNSTKFKYFFFSHVFKLEFLTQNEK